MDSWYAFATAHIHVAIYRGKVLLTAEGKTIKNKEEIFSPLRALQGSTKLAVIRYLRHQKRKDPVSKVNDRAGEAASHAAL